MEIVYVRVRRWGREINDNDDQYEQSAEGCGNEKEGR
jgi:hypothetical protein